ncbi:hypothetical protein HYR69_02935 [Candidatus Sumerlaeota bacterium]|nr:hypothetical protein [Candidatus Sumerlaeota bacterium]
MVCARGKAAVLDKMPGVGAGKAADNARERVFGSGKTGGASQLNARLV